MSAPNAPTALVVEDESLIAMYLCDVLEEAGLPVCGVAGDGETAVRLAEIHHPAVVLMDVRLKGLMDGVEAASRIKANGEVAIIFVTASHEPETVARIATIKAADVLFKPVRPEDLKAAIARTLG